jgi:hypothetical protein
MEFGKSKITYAVPPTPPPPGPDAPKAPSIPADAVPAAVVPAEEPTPQPRFSPPAVRSLAPLASAPEPKPANRLPKKAGAFFSQRMIVMASAAAALLILGTFLALRKPKTPVPVRPPEIIDHLDLSELSALPEPLQAGAQAILAGTFQLPPWLQAMDRASGGDLEFPVHEGVEEVQPTLRWSFVSPSTNVAVVSPTHQVVARAEIFQESHWTLPVELQRGTVYTWEVATLGQVRRNAFRVIDETEAGWLQSLRLAHGQSHLLMGMASLELGLMSQAQHEFQGLAQEHPHSPEAAQLLRTVNGFLVH